MIIPTQNASARPVAYGGGIKSTSQPGFGTELSALLARMQMMQSSPQALPGFTHGQTHRHDGNPGNLAGNVMPPPMAG
ncbi:MAG TPA: hypothetical protein VF286_01205 [Acidiphilium sp.]